MGRWSCRAAAGPAARRDLHRPHSAPDGDRAEDRRADVDLSGAGEQHVLAEAAGENIDAGALGGGSAELTEHLVTRPYPGSPEGDADGYIDGYADGYIDPAYFHQLFCADVAPELAAFIAESQRGVVLSALVAPSGVPGWRTVPSWCQVSTHDAAIPPEAERAMGERSGARISEVVASHAAMISQPKATLEVILAAARQS